MVKDIVFGQFVEFRFQKISLTPKFHQNHEKLSSKSTSASKIMLDSVLEIPKTVFPTSLLKFCLLTPNAPWNSERWDPWGRCCSFCFFPVFSYFSSTFLIPPHTPKKCLLLKLQKILQVWNFWFVTELNNVRGRNPISQGRSFFILFLFFLR